MAGGEVETQLSGVRAIGHALQLAGATALFAMVGGSNVAWSTYAVRDCGLDLVKCRHEESAVSGAMGYARVTGGVGYCTVTRGVGFANAINALICAVKVHGPVVMLVGESPTPNPLTTQNVEQQQICRLIGAGFRHAATAAEAVEAILDATADARDLGVPQVISLAAAVTSTKVELSGVVARERRARVVDPSQVDVAVALLAASDRPLVLAGQGAVLAGCRTELSELADALGADVATSLVANRFFAGHEGELGVCGGWSTPLSFDRLKGHDVVLAVGASLNLFTLSKGAISDGAILIRCDVRDSATPAVGAEGEVLVEGDARDVVRALAAAWKRAGHPPRARMAQPDRSEQLASVLSVDLPHDSARGLDLRRALAWFDGALPEDRIVVTDSGRTAALTSALVGARDARSWVLGRGYGCVGQGLGVAVGAAAAARDRRVVLFCGDGGFMMGISALDSARLHALDNLAVVILDDGQYGSEVKYLDQYDLPLDLIQQPLPDIPALAQVYGGTGVVVRDHDELERLEIPERGLFLVDARLDPQVNFHHALADSVSGKVHG